ncbi:MAG: sugar ABC transporter substrate-binding protein [Opitutaceae bacterium]|nr:sugar ABC transporter substrate-binding protein [Opitutaceae bacterium]
MATFTSPYSSASVKEFKRITREQGCGLIILDAQSDIQREAFNMDNLVAKRVDAILVNAVDSKGSRACLRKAARRGVAVVCFNSTVDRPEELGVRAYSGPEYYEQGVSAARVAIQHNPAGKVVMITGDPGYSAANDREKGFTDTLAKAAPNMKMLNIQTANWMRESAQRVMSDFITRYGREIDIIYSQDDNMTAGAVNALKAAGYQRDNRPFVISIGAMADGLPLVADGWIDSTIMQSPKEEALLAMQVALKLLRADRPEPFKNYFMSTSPVNRANVAEVIAMHLWD